MKKILVLITALTMSMSLFAEKVGIVDIQSIMFSHPKAKTINEELQAEKTKLEAEINVRGNAYLANKKALEEKGEAATEEEKAALLEEEKNLQAYIGQLQQQLSDFERQKTGSLQAEIMTAIQEVAKTKGLDVILDRSTVIYGGEDVTKDVEEFLNSAEKISLD